MAYGGTIWKLVVIADAKSDTLWSTDKEQIFFLLKLVFKKTSSHTF